MKVIGERADIIVSLLCIVALLVHLILKPNAGGTLFYLILPIPLNMIVFLYGFRNWIDSR